VDALQEYRFEWDESTQAFSPRPLHNWASHTADAFRYLALVVKHSDALTRKPKAPPQQAGFNLSQLFDEKERENSL
jgi:phage terminase large subunit